MFFFTLKKIGLLWIGEQIPGNVTTKDVTDVLERAYWGSYNVPAIEYIYDITGNKEMADTYGPQMSYDLAPRARYPLSFVFRLFFIRTINTHL